jgi:SAM-dependent methyltransferase
MGTESGAGVHAGLPPSAWVQRWSHLVAPKASVLDVACGSGRHVRWFAARGCRVTGVDRDAAALTGLEAIAETCVADIEGAPWPLPGRRFDAVVVTNYLWRELLPTLVASVADHGVLIYETFSAGNASVGKPSNPLFLLQAGELLSATAGLRVVAYEDGFLDGPGRFVQRIVAVREAPADASAAPQRYPL